MMKWIFSTVYLGFEPDLIDMDQKLKIWVILYDSGLQLTIIFIFRYFGIIQILAIHEILGTKVPRIEGTYISFVALGTLSAI